jgi:hypothetical protein
MSDTHSESASNDVGPSFSAEEDAFFASGGESEIPLAPAAGADDGGDGTDESKPAAEKTGDKVTKMVELSALHEERRMRKERDADLRARDLEIAELRGKFSIIERLNTPAATDTTPATPPTAEEDIFGAVNHLGEAVAAQAKRLADQDAETKAAGERVTFVNDYKADAAAFERGDPEKGVAAVPDYRKAYDFLLASRAADLRAIGYDTPEKLHNALTADEFAIAQMAREQKKSPAAMLYALAQARGYKTAAAAPAEGGTAAERLAKIEEGQAANKSLGDLGGEAPGGAMTVAQLIAMPMAEFEEWTAKNPAKAKRLMGG